MGCCQTTNTKVDSFEVRKLPPKKTEDNRSKYKVLMIGTGNGGKSTLFKTIRKHNGDDVFDNRAKEETANSLRSILVQYTMRLLLIVDSMDESTDCIPNMDHDPNSNNTIRECIDEFILIYSQISGLKTADIRRNPLAEVDMTDHLQEFGERLGKIIPELWSEKRIQNAFYQNRNYYFFPDSLPGFLDRAKEIMDISYEASEDDILRTGVRTTGVIHYTYSKWDRKILVIDPGAQRSERGKWPRQFDETDVLIFVVPLNHYNTVIFEDESQNGMYESLSVFENYSNREHFQNTDVCILFNKVDLFSDSLREYPLSVSFGRECAKWNGPEYWDGPDYALMPGEEEPSEWQRKRPDFESAQKAALSFIESLFRNRFQSEDKELHIHYSSVVDPKKSIPYWLKVEDILIHRMWEEEER